MLGAVRIGGQKVSWNDRCAHVLLVLSGPHLSLHGTFLHHTVANRSFGIPSTSPSFLHSLQTQPQLVKRSLVVLMGSLRCYVLDTFPSRHHPSIAAMSGQRNNTHMKSRGLTLPLLMGVCRQETDREGFFFHCVCARDPSLGRKGVVRCGQH